MGSETHSSPPDTRAGAGVATQGTSDPDHDHHLGLCALQQPCFLGMWLSQPVVIEESGPQCWDDR